MVALTYLYFIIYIKYSLVVWPPVMHNLSPSNSFSFFNVIVSVDLRNILPIKMFIEFPKGEL